MITYNWDISQLDCAPQEDGLTDVVVVAHYQCIGTVDEHSARVYGTCSFTLSTGENFTPYNQLTKEQVLGWIWNSGVDKEATEVNIDAQIYDLINPSIVVLPLPWTN